MFLGVVNLLYFARVWVGVLRWFFDFAIFWTVITRPLWFYVFGLKAVDFGWLRAGTGCRGSAVLVLCVLWVYVGVVFV